MCKNIMSLLNAKKFHNFIPNIEIITIIWSEKLKSHMVNILAYVKATTMTPKLNHGTTIKIFPYNLFILPITFSTLF